MNALVISNPYSPVQRALCIYEVLGCILGFITLQNLASASRVSKLWFDLAVPTLWTKLPSVTPLLRLLGPLAGDGFAGLVCITFFSTLSDSHSTADHIPVLAIRFSPRHSILRISTASYFTDCMSATCIIAIVTVMLSPVSAPAIFPSTQSLGSLASSLPLPGPSYRIFKRFVGRQLRKSTASISFLPFCMHQSRPSKYASANATIKPSAILSLASSMPSQGFKACH